MIGRNEYMTWMNSSNLEFWIFIADLPALIIESGLCTLPVVPHVCSYPFNWETGAQHSFPAVILCPGATDTSRASQSWVLCCCWQDNTTKVSCLPSVQSADQHGFNKESRLVYKPRDVCTNVVQETASRLLDLLPPVLQLWISNKFLTLKKQKVSDASQVNLPALLLTPHTRFWNLKHVQRKLVYSPSICTSQSVTSFIRPLRIAFWIGLQ